MSKNKLMKTAFVIMFTSILFSACGVYIGKAVPPPLGSRFSAQNGRGQATIYVTPSNNSFLSPPTLVNDSFTVTVRIANYTYVAGWQVKIVFSHEQLYTTAGNVTLAQDFIFPPLAYPVIPPIIGVYNATHDFILMSTTTYGAIEYSGGDAGLVKVKFYIKAVPTAARTMESQIWLEPVDTWTIDESIDENAEILYSGFYRIKDVPSHDIGIVSITVSATTVSQGDLLIVNVTVFNEGLFAETVQLSAYANYTRIDSATFVLAAKNLATIVLTWNTTTASIGKYVIGAYAPPVEGETHTEDNGLADGWVTVIPTYSGDINHDGKVDGRDIAIISRAFNTRPGDLLWDSRADLNGDLKVDGKDLAIVAKNFGT